MTDRGEIESKVLAIYKARDSNDIDALMALIDPDCGFRVVGNDRLGALTQRVSGLETLRSTLTGLIAVWDFSSLQITSLHIDGDIAFAHRSGEVRFIPLDRRMETEFIDKLTFRDGLLVEIEEFVDTLQVAEVNGLVEFT